MTVNEVIKYVRNYVFEGKLNADGSPTKQQLTKFMTDVQNKMMEIPLENIKGQLLPYCGEINAGIGKAEGWKNVTTF